MTDQRFYEQKQKEEELQQIQHFKREEVMDQDENEVAADTEYDMDEFDEELRD